MTESRPLLPPFTEETARQKVLAAEAAYHLQADSASCSLLRSVRLDF